MTKKINFLKMPLLFFFLFFSQKNEATPLSIELSAPVAILMNAENGKVLFAKNAEMESHPASVTKIATALYVLHKVEEKDYDQKVKASYEAVATVSTALRRFSGKHPSYRLEFGGTHMGIKVGEELSLTTLLYGLMLSSGNDAANVLAEAVSGSVPLFLKELNQFLREIGCKNTTFHNPHGMPDPLHVTTAYDLAVMGRVAMKNPFFRQLVSSIKYEREQTNKQPPSLLVQHNALVKPGKYFYPYANGIKTGYTLQAGYTLVASAEKQDRKLIAVVMNCDEIGKRYRNAIQLFEAAFNEVKQTRKLLCKEHDFFHQKIEGAKERLDAELAQDVSISFYPSEESEFHSELVWFPLPLPILAGDEVGFVRLLDEEGKERSLVPLLAVSPVHPTFLYVVSEYKKKSMEYLRSKRNYLGYGFAAILFVSCFYCIRRKRGYA